MNSPSRGQYISPRLPLPTVVQVYNWIPPHHQDRSDKDAPNNKWFRPTPSVKLLHNVRLDLVVNQQQQSLFIESKNRKAERILYSRSICTGTVQPVWRHLNESIDSLSVEEYESMILRLCLVNEDDNDKNNATEQQQQIFQLSIHPSKLMRLKKSISPFSERLPLNFIVVHFSDDSMRVSPAAYGALGEAVTAAGTAAEEEFARFGDTVFRILDQVTPAPTPNAAVSLLDLSDEYDEKKTTGSVCSLSNNDHDNDDDNNKDDDDSLRQPQHDEKSLRQRLRQQIEQQELALQQEMDELARNDELEQLRDCYETNRHQMSLIVAATMEEMSQASQMQFRLTAQQVSLVQQLQTIYPIAMLSGSVYSIRGFNLPADLFAGNLSEDELSAALGYSCHAVHMLSKYLVIQLRYRLLCHNSRSGIQDDRAILYPLFQGRSVEHDQLEHGVKLLHRNVDCICGERGITVSPNMHLLQKVNRIYQLLMEGC
jgi:hypothetical protein